MRGDGVVVDAEGVAMARSDCPAGYSAAIRSTSEARSRRCTGRGVGFESRPASSEAARSAAENVPSDPSERRLRPRSVFSTPLSTRWFRCAGGFESCPIRSTRRCRNRNEIGLSSLGRPGLKEEPKGSAARTPPPIQFGGVALPPSEPDTRVRPEPVAPGTRRSRRCSSTAVATTRRGTRVVQLG